MPTPIYHITHLNNLRSIVKQNGLWCEAERANQGINCLNIAYMSLKDRRSQTAVPCGERGALSEYVPFYFAPRSPMLYVINKGGVDSYKGGQKPILHLVSTVERVQKAGLSFVFTDGHAVMSLSRFFDDFRNLQYIDWDVMKATYWNDTPDDPDRSRRRQAEFLVSKFVPWDLFLGIGVIDATIAKKVESIISEASYQPRVKEKQAWYY